jgi:hypothetical protein
MNMFVLCRFIDQFRRRRKLSAVLVILASLATLRLLNRQKELTVELALAREVVWLVRQRALVPLGLKVL